MNKSLAGLYKKLFTITLISGDVNRIDIVKSNGSKLSTDAHMIEVKNFNQFFTYDNFSA